MHPHVPLLTAEEKARLLSGESFWATRSVDRVGVAGVVLTDGPHGVRLQRGSADHLGLNESEPATAFPTAAATGSTWDPNLLAKMGAALGAESRALGVDILLGPGVNIKRSPLCGRNFEYFSEDPLLAGALGAAWVSGVQSQGVGASLKHYAANNQETDRMRVSAEVDERTLREIYLPAFEKIVKEAQPATVMCSYNRINGVYASQNRWLLTDVLREDWGYEGYVVSDWGAVVDPVAAVAAGLDLEMPGSGDNHPNQILDAVRSGTLDEAVLDVAVSRMLTVHDGLRHGRRPAPPVDFDAHHELARELAVDSAVLLFNDDNLLPLDPTTGGMIAVIGEFARTPRYQGAGSSHIIPTRLDDALTALGEHTDREVRFAPGFTFDGAEDGALHDEAVALVGSAEVVLLFLGLPDDEESEGFDRQHLQLPPSQLDLAAKIADANANVVVILSNGGVVTLAGVAGRVPAILETWLGGQAGGSAVADIVFGSAEPGGRLAETIPLALQHTPAHVNWPGTDGSVRYGEGVHVGYRWYQATDRDVAFPFGFGLGYTTFSLSDLHTDVPDPEIAAASVSLMVENTGTRPGATVVQLYVGDDDATVTRSPRELRAFEKVRLQPGQRQRITFHLDDRAFAFWGSGGWTVEPGTFTIEVGTSSQDLPLRATVLLNVPAPARALDKNSTLEEWLAHPIGGDVLRTAANQMGQAGALMTSPDMLKLMGSMPLTTLMNFSTDSGVSSDDAIGRLLEEVHRSEISAE